MAVVSTDHTVRLDYGTNGLRLDITGLNSTILRPEFVEGLHDEHGAFRDAVRHPIGSAPLTTLAGPQSKLAVVIPDITRAFPGPRILPWFFEELTQVRPNNVRELYT